MANVDFYVTPDKLQTIADGADAKFSLDGLGLKPIVVQALADRGFLRLPRGPVAQAGES